MCDLRALCSIHDVKYLCYFVFTVLLSYSPTVDANASVPEEDAVNCLRCQQLCEKQYSMIEVSLRCEPSSCWIVIDNYVYDVTHFKNEVW